MRAAVVEAAPYEPSDAYALCELTVEEARCKGYGDVALPERRRWPHRP